MDPMPDQGIGWAEAACPFSVCALVDDLLDSTVVVQGELDAATAPHLARAIATALADHPFTLTIDLTQLCFVDASGLSVLQRTRRRLSPSTVASCSEARR
jgi:anti-anti-sigma regulatory factor